MRRHAHYERDDETFGADAYTVDGWRGIAFYVLGWETEPDEETEWTGHEVRTGMVTVVMIGDDKHWHVDPADVAPLEREAYCGVCERIARDRLSCRDGPVRVEAEDLEAQKGTAEVLAP